MNKHKIGDVVLFKKDPDMIGTIQEVTALGYHVNWSLGTPPDHVSGEELEVIKEFPADRKIVPQNPFKVGDRVRYLNSEGTINTIFRSTVSSVLVKFDGGVIYPVRTQDLKKIYPNTIRLQEVKLNFFQKIFNRIFRFTE